MPTYEYVCRNENCEDPGRTEKNCKIGERNDFPTCDTCEQDMSRYYGKAPLINWRYFSANGVWTTSALGPAQRADRRLQKYVNGQPIWRPIHKETFNNKKEKE